MVVVGGLGRLVGCVGLPSVHHTFARIALKLRNLKLFSLHAAALEQLHFLCYCSFTAIPTMPFTQPMKVSPPAASVGTELSIPARAAETPTQTQAQKKTNLIASVRAELRKLGCLDEADHPAASIATVLQCTNDDPMKAAHFLHGVQPEKKPRTRSSSNSESTISGRSIVSVTSDTKSSHDMLRSASLLKPSSTRVILQVPVPEKGVTYFPDDEGRNKLSVKAKSDLGVMKRFGKQHQDNYPGDIDKQRRFNRAAAETGVQCQMVECDPDPNGLNASARQGTFAKCLASNCGKNFACCANDGFSNALFECHKTMCGKKICGCGLDETQLLKAFKALNPKGSVQRRVSAHMKSCTVNHLDYCRTLEEWAPERDTLISKMHAMDDKKKAEAKKKWALPPKGGVKTMLQEATLSKEERARLLKKWTANLCFSIYPYFDKRRNGSSPATIEVMNTMVNAGVAVDKVKTFSI
eukprot:scaffold7444_cov67-Skeletonema_marinoi.AAC.1